MKTGNNIAAVLLALVTAMAFQPVLAEEHTERETAGSEVEQSSRKRAADANREAVDGATRSILEATRLDLDIRLIDRTSPTLARAAGDD